MMLYLCENIVACKNAPDGGLRGLKPQGVVTWGSSPVSYDGYGSGLAELRNGISSASSSSVGYTGREYNAVTGLQYNRNRYYDPSTRRWMTKDPLGFAAGDTNLYRYVKNQQANFTDPRGTEPGTIALGTAIALGGVALAYYGANEVDQASLSPVRFDQARYDRGMTIFQVGVATTVVGGGIVAAPIAIPAAAQMAMATGTVSASSAYGLATAGFVAGTAQSTLHAYNAGPNHNWLSLTASMVGGPLGAFNPYAAMGSLAV